MDNIAKKEIAKKEANKLLSETLIDKPLPIKDQYRIANYLMANEEVKKYLVELIANISKGKIPENEFETQKAFWIKYQGENLLESIIYEANEFTKHKIKKGNS